MDGYFGEEYLKHGYDAADTIMVFWWRKAR